MKKIIVVAIVVIIIILTTAILINQNRPQQEYLIVEVFFNNNNLNPEFSCDKVFSSKRSIPKTPEPERAALLELLAGPTQGEVSEGFFTTINSGVKLRSISIIRGVAEVDFDERLESGIAGSCLVTSIRSQISETLKQFSSVDEVIISVNGRTEDVLQP